MIQVTTDPVMVPVRLEHLNAIANFFYNRIVPAEGEVMLGWLRAAVKEHARKTELDAKRKEATESHEAVVRAQSVAAANGDSVVEE